MRLPASVPSKDAVQHSWVCGLTHLPGLDLHNVNPETGNGPRETLPSTPGMSTTRLRVAANQQRCSGSIRTQDTYTRTHPDREQHTRVRSCTDTIASRKKEDYTGLLWTKINRCASRLTQQPLLLLCNQADTASLCGTCTAVLRGLAPVGHLSEELLLKP